MYIYKTVLTASELLLCCKLCNMLWTKTLLLSSIMLVYCQLDNISFVISEESNISSNRRLVGCCTVFATLWIKSSSTQFLRVISSLSQLSLQSSLSPSVSKSFNCFASKEWVCLENMTWLFHYYDQKLHAGQQNISLSKPEAQNSAGICLLNGLSS